MTKSLQSSLLLMSNNLRSERRFFTTKIHQTTTGEHVYLIKGMSGLTSCTTITAVFLPDTWVTTKPTTQSAELITGQRWDKISSPTYGPVLPASRTRSPLWVPRASFNLWTFRLTGGTLSLWTLQDLSKCPANSTRLPLWLNLTEMLTKMINVDLPKSC